MLYLRTFGGCHVERDGVRLDELTAQRKALACLAMLAVAGSRGVSRDVLAAMLWPESDDERARASLKQLVHALRMRLGAPDVVVTQGDLRLNAEHVASDVGQFRDALQRHDYGDAAGLYAGSFLEGFYLRGAGGFEEWASEQRSALAHDFSDAVEKLAEAAELRGDHRGAVTRWRRLVDVDALSARATVGLMRALDAAGERAAALHQATIFRRRVREELEAEPDPSVVELAERLRATPKAASPPPVLAVLPFANTSDDPADEQFSDGLTDELIGTIGKMRGLAVVGRTSTFAFKGRHADLSEIAEKLNANSILEGSVRRLGDRVKVGVQLVRSSDGVVLWSEIYDREARDLFAVQTDIARSVSLALRLRLEPERAPAPRANTVDPEAHDCYLRGRFFVHRPSADELRQAVTCFERAVARDPMFARAYAGLADARLLLAIMGHAPASPEVSGVHAAISRALALDGDLAEAHASLACVLFAFDWEWQAAEREFRTAIELDPAYGLAHHRYGLFLMYQNRLDEAREVLESARASDPLAASVTMNLGRLHLTASRPERAVPLLQTAIELSPHLVLAHEQLGHSYLLMDAKTRALAAFHRVAELSGPRGATRLAYALAATGDDRAARRIVADVAARPDAAIHAFGLAMASAGLADCDGAFAWLDRAYAERDPFLHTALTTRAFEPMHDDPRWASLLTRIGLRQTARPLAWR